MTTTLKAVLGVILIFVFGFLAGAVSTSIFAQQKVAAFLKHPAVVLMAAMEKRLTKNLNLDAKQKEQIHKYFMENLQRHRQLQAQIQPQIQVLNESTVSQISAALRPDQQQRFSQNLKDLQNRFWKYASSPDAGNPSGPANQSDEIGTNSGTGEAPKRQ